MLQVTETVDKDDTLYAMFHRDNVSLSTRTPLHVVWRVGACACAGASKHKPAEHAKAAGRVLHACTNGEDASIHAKIVAT
jgi:hypothetical protein